MDRYKPHILLGDCLEILPTLPADHFHCCVTSPPYFALRRYLDDSHPEKHKEIGSEPTPEAFIQTMVTVFREVRRVLHPSGLLFLNLGDGYSSTPPGNKTKGVSASSTLNGVSSDTYRDTLSQGCQTKRDTSSFADQGSLLNIPHRVAEALRGDGWIWRQTIVWSKPAPMPESVAGWRWVRCRVNLNGNTNYDSGKNAEHIDRRKVGFNERYDNPETHKAQYLPCPGCDKCRPNDGWILRRGKGRCTTAHEYIFVLAKTDRYFWDSAAFCEPGNANDHNGKSVKKGGFDSKFANDVARKGDESFRKVSATRNPRSVWTIGTEPSKEKHFASYPSELVRRCLQAGTSDGGCCGACGAPYAPLVESEKSFESGSGRSGNDPIGKNGTKLQGGGYTGDVRRGPVVTNQILGYRATCRCNAGCVPCRILEPFLGTGTTLQTAWWTGRQGTGIELNPAYAEIAHRKVTTEPRWSIRRRNKKTAKPPAASPRQLPLFS